jgi:bis(5'-nucleosyl)-tetraphosphatase (symmetrical)
VATYAIGDIQGCYAEFTQLLDLISFDPERDRLWIVGDLVNRGPDSLAVVRHVRSLGAAAVCVLGNHDLHLLAIRYGGHSPGSGDTFGDLLAADDADEIFAWMRRMPLLVDDPGLGFCMVHAGIPHIWNLVQASRLAREVERVIQGDDYLEFFAAMYGNRPDRWDDALLGMDRWRVITNYFTRMRLIDKAGRLDFTHKGALDAAPRGWHPWYRLRMRNPLPRKLLFGHWAAIDGVTGDSSIIALDTGCVWGRSLTALCLETGRLTRVPATNAA